MKLFYNVRGAGEPLILIPGFASGAWNWFRQTADLSKNFQVITYDPRGIGRSQPENSGDLSMEDFVADVLWILDELELESSHILGASFGGFVAQTFAVSFPAKVDKLILACTSAGGANHVRPAAEILQSFAPDPSMTLGEKVRKFIRPAFTDEFNRNSSDEVEQICQMREENPVADETYLAQLQAAFSFDWESRLHQIKNETLVITGDRDIVVPMGNSLNLAKNIPNAELKIIEGGSHLFFIEKAVEFNRAVKDFLVRQL